MLVCILTSDNGAGVGVCPVPEGYGSKRQLLMDGRSMGRGDTIPLAQSTETSTALPNPTPCRDRQQDILTGSQIPVIPLILPHPLVLLLQHKNQTLEKPRKTCESTADDPDITLMPSVT